MSQSNISQLRREYKNRTLDEKDISEDPFTFFEQWMNEALGSDIIDPTAMTVATASADGIPTTRVLLLKEYSRDGMVFFTNYESRKGRQLAENPRACMHFFWPELERQITVEGRVEKLRREESEEYFHSRPVESQIGAWASHQSTPIGSRKELEDRFAELQKTYSDGNVPMPEYWGGYRLQPHRFEFWQGRPSRLHDRIEYLLKGDNWQIRRLEP